MQPAHSSVARIAAGRRGGGCAFVDKRFMDFQHSHAPLRKTRRQTTIHVPVDTTPKTLALFLGGLVLLAGSYGTLRELRATLELQRADRFVQAVDQLGKENLELRLGGIYALERLAANSEQDYWPIMHILTTYVREHASISNAHALKEPPRRLAADVQAILDVLGRRRHTYADGESQRLDLRGTDLRRANLAGANFAGVILSAAHLEEANLAGARLDDALLRDTHLEQANLTDAAMARAFLLNSGLKGARLRAANLRDTYLGGARFDDADLLSADLTGALNLTWDQIKTAKKDNRTRLPDYLRLPAPAPGAR